MNYKDLIDKVSKSIDDELEKQKNLKDLIVEKNTPVESLFKSLEIQKVCEEHSKNILQYIVFSTLNLDVSNEIIQKQIQLDIELLTPLLFQYKLSNYMIKKILNEIEIGDTSPKMFDALSKMQKTNSENLKDIISMFSLLEEKYKKVSNEKESDTKHTESSEGFNVKDNFVEISDMRKFIISQSQKNKDK